MNKTLDEILHKDVFWKDICIIGIPTSGKTYLSEQLKKRNPYHEVIHTDIYKVHGYEEGLYCLMEDLAITPAPRITEGILCYRALRKGLETETYNPDVIFMCEISRKRQVETYHKERDPKKLLHMRSFEVGLMTVWNKYLQLSAERGIQDRPEIIHFENNF